MAGSSVRFQWQGGTGTIAAGCDAFGDRLNAGLADICQAAALQGEATMRANRPWSDETGAARAGLVGDYQQQGDAHVITMGHSVDYGIYLELKNGGRFAIVRPTIDTLAPDVVRQAAALLGGSAA